MTTRTDSSLQDLPTFPWAQFMGSPNGWAVFCQNAHTAEPVVRNAARAQLEFSSLVGTRVKAWAAIPETLSQCRTPVDVLQAQTAFWQTAAQDYSAATHRIVSAWSEMLPSGMLPSDGKAMPRDFMTLPEASDERRRPGESRRAA